MDLFRALFNNYKLSFLLIFLVKLIFLINYYFVDDAFIIFRTAYNFGNYYEYSYNLGEKFSGITSWLYGGFVSIISLLFNNNFIKVVTVTNTILSIFSSLLIYLIFIDINKEKKNFKNYIFLLLIFINPSITSIGTIGLETSFVVFFVSLFFYTYYFKKNSFYIFIFGILIILTRIELFSLILIFLLSNLFKKEKKIKLLFSIIIFGICLNLYGSYLINGYYLPETAISKLQTLTPTYTYNFIEIFDRILKLLIFEQSYFIGFKTKFFPFYFNALITAIFIFILARSIINFIFKILKKHKLTNSEDLIFSISLASLAIPAAYIISGQVWDWYFLPFSFISILILSNFIASFKLNKIKEVIIALVIIVVCLINFLIKYNISFQEHNFRSDVGKFIASNSLKDSRLFLEPAGFIPFYAKLRTIDTVGLTSKKIREYRNNNNHDWWFDYVFTENPEFIIDRKNILKGESKDGYILFSKTQNIWINNNYKLVKEFNYKEYLVNYNFNNILEKFIINLGSHSNYYVFKKI